MMAFGSHSLRRLHSVGASNAEGLQMKLSDHVKPTGDILLPPHIELSESSILQKSQYPFDVEETFLKWIRDARETERERILAEEEERKKKAKKDEGGTTLDPDGRKNDITTNGNEKDVRVEAKASIPPVQANLSTEILMPTPTESNKGAELNHRDHMIPPHMIDLADFENVASDPFEATELQTLNDIEELRSVLASSTASAPVNMDVDITSRMRTEEPVGNCPEAVTTDNKIQVTATALQKSELHDNLIEPDSFPKDTSYVDHDDLSVSLDNFMLHSSTNSPKAKVKDPLPPISSIPKGKGASPTAPPDVNKIQEISTSNQRKRGASSVLESTSLSAKNNLLIHRKDLPPSYPKNLSKYSPLPPTPSTNTNVGPSSERENLEFSDLDEEGQNFVLMITAMGFPKCRTARVVKRLGHDDKLVIDTLCAIDRLCSQGFMEDKVELALNLLDSDEDKVTTFLKLWKRFQELGFKSDDIKRELLLHGNEEEKVLDALTSKT